MINKSGGAATNAGSDYQQRISAYFVLHMGLGLDCSRALERRNSNGKVLKVAFETDDDIDDIVLTHENSKSYLQAKRKLTLSDKDGSDFYKAIEQFVKQFHNSQNDNDSYIAITSGETSKSISKHLKKITNSARLSEKAIEQNPLSKSELAAYGKLKRCIQKSYVKNGFGNPASDELEKLIKQIYIVVLDVEQDGIHEKSFLESLVNKFNIESNLIWNLVIAQALDWSKNRQSIDFSGINEFLSKFKIKEIERRDDELDSFFKVKFDADNYTICSGRELVLMESPYPDHDYQLVELKRFDERGNFRIKFHENAIEMSNGDKFEIYARFSTYKGAERFLEENAEFTDNLLIVPINSNDSGEYDNTPIAKAYSEKVRGHILANNDATKCIHCQNGLSYPSNLVEIQEEGLPFDAGSIHSECLRVSDRVLGKTINDGVKKSPEFNNFDFNKWISLLDKSQGLWSGMKEYPVNQPIKNILWNSNPVGDSNGGYCIKTKLKDGSHQYIQERGKVQRYNRDAALEVCARLEEWRLDSIKNKSPLCYSIDGNVQGMQQELQKHSTKPLDLVECESFKVVKFTRGIGIKHDKLNNFYAPILVFSDFETGEYITFENAIFLITAPTELKVYIENWNKVNYTLDSYRLDIIETDAKFDKFMHWTKHNALEVLVDPFFDNEANLIKGAIIEDLEEIKKQSETGDKDEIERFSLLFTIDNGNGTFTQLFRDFVNDVTLLLYDKCTSNDCRCMGCQMYDIRIAHYGKDNIDLRQSNENTLVLNLSDSESDWTQEFIDDNSVAWSDWEQIVT
ncbi:hypothetical protein VV869_13905 [Photobacterium sp. MCCC 1A19761]|uniref:hypothetical protein n=1 Tax=Photobacterium sp. MCCC 1A19761 TaxID=3115000 RepID=UPI00307EED9C